MAKESESTIQFSKIIATLTVVVSIIAIIPAFLSLNQEKPVVYWSYELRHYVAPEGIDKGLFVDFLKKNNIPSHRFQLRLKNCGNAPSKETKISISTQGQIVRYVFTPSQSKKPIWVDVPPDKELGFGSGVSDVVQSVKNLAPNRLLLFGIAYESQTSAPPGIEVFSDGIECKRVADMLRLKPWSPYKVFYLPGYIFAGGIVITLIWILLSVVFSNPDYKRILVAIGKSTLTDVFIISKQLLSLDEIMKIYRIAKRERKPHDDSTES